MSFWRQLSVICGLALGLWSGAVAAQEGRSSGYVGFGAAPTGTDEAQETPLALGFYHVSDDTQFLFGFDLGMEGTTFDGTYGIDTLEQGLSFNLLMGRNIYRDGVMAVDLGVLLGFREVAIDCPDSFLGWACYADQEPETEYDLNFGGVAAVSFSSFLVGMRATDVSAQVLVGFNF